MRNGYKGCCKVQLVKNIFMRITELVKFILVAAATAFLFGHAAFAAFIRIAAIEFNTGLLTHAIVYFHRDARGHRHVQYRHYADEDLLHYTAKVI